MKRDNLYKVLIFFIIFFLIEPFLFFWLGYFVGWIAKITIGKVLIEGLNLVHISIALNQIPLLAGTLSWIGSFFYQFKMNKD